MLSAHVTDVILCTSARIPRALVLNGLPSGTTCARQKKIIFFRFIYKYGLYTTLFAGVQSFSPLPAARFKSVSPGNLWCGLA